jgi:hypothetical protein
MQACFWGLEIAGLEAGQGSEGDGLGSQRPCTRCCMDPSPEGAGQEVKMARGARTSPMVAGSHAHEAVMGRLATHEAVAAGGLTSQGSTPWRLMNVCSRHRGCCLDHAHDAAVGLERFLFFSSFPDMGFMVATLAVQ